MTDRIALQLNNAQDGHKALMYAWTQYAKPRLIAGHRLQLQIQPETRSLALNRLLHSSIGDIAGQVEWAGAKRSLEVWKRLLTASFLRARGENVQVLPALDGHGVDVVIARTSKMSNAMASELVEYIHAWGTEFGVEWSPASVAEDASCAW